MSNNSIDIAIMTILPEEYQAVITALREHDLIVHENNIHNLYAWYRCDLIVANGKGIYRIAVGLMARPGTSSSTLAILRTITAWNPRHLLLVGIAGGLPLENLQKGDVVISDVIYGYEYGKAKEFFEPRPNNIYQVDGALLRSALAFAFNSNWNKNLSLEEGLDNDPKAIPGPVASGDKVVDLITDEFFGQVQKLWPKLLAIEMEGAGAGAAIDALHEEGKSIGFLMIRGISDMPKSVKDTSCSPTENASLRNDWKKYASLTAAKFAIGFIAGFWPIPPQPRDDLPQSNSNKISEKDAQTGILGQITPSIGMGADIDKILTSNAPLKSQEESNHSLSDEFAYKTNNLLSKIKIKITGIDRTYEREEVFRIEDQLKRLIPVVLTGDAGTGKSGIGSMLAESAIKMGKTTLYLNAGLLGHITDEPMLRNYFSITEPLSYAIVRLGRIKGFRLIIDQLDSALDKPIANVLSDLAIECSKSPGVEVVVITRNRESHEKVFLEKLTNNKFVKLTCQQLSEEEATDALNQLGITDLSSDLIKMSQNLLNLDIIATIKKNQPAFSFTNIYDELALWDGLIQALQNRETDISNFIVAEQTITDAMKLAKRALNQEDQSFHLDLPLSVSYRRLESWGIIAKFDNQIYRFRHEKLQDYLYARYAADRGMMPSSVLDEISILSTKNVFLWMERIYKHRQSILRREFMREMLNV